MKSLRIRNVSSILLQAATLVCLGWWFLAVATMWNGLPGNLSFWNALPGSPGFWESFVVLGIWGPYVGAALSSLSIWTANKCLRITGVLTFLLCLPFVIIDLNWIGLIDLDCFF